MARVVKLPVLDWVAQVMGGEPPRPRNLYAVASAEASGEGGSFCEGARCFTSTATPQKTTLSVARVAKLLVFDWVAQVREASLLALVTCTP